MAIPLGYPSPPREKVSLRSPLPDGGKASSDTGVPIQEATTENRSLSWVLIDKSLGYQQSSLPQDITTGSLASRYHQYSSKYSAGTCPILTGGMAFFISPFLPAIKFPHDGRGSVAILVCGCSSMSEAYWRRVLRQDEWRAGSLF